MGVQNPSGVQTHVSTLYILILLSITFSTHCNNIVEDIAPIWTN
jgi:hypothetical protein